MSDNNTDLDEDEEIEIFFGTLNKDDFKKLSSASVIVDNFESMNEIIEPLRDTENEFQNPSLKIAKTIRSKIQIITPKKELDKENSNYIKDLLNFQKGYEKNAGETNKTIEQIKKNFIELSKSITSLKELIEEIRNKYFDQVKIMMTPFTKKNELLENFDKSKLSKDKLKKFEEQNKKLDKRIDEYDKNLANIIKDLKKVFNRINLNIKGYVENLNKLDEPINSMIEEIENIFNEFEEKSKKIIKIIYNNSPKEKEEAMKIFREIHELNGKIISLIDEKQKELNAKNNNLKNEKEKCIKDFNEIKTLEKESSIKINELLNETKKLITEINQNLELCSLPIIEVQVTEFKGLEIDKIKEKIVDGTNVILEANEKLKKDIYILKTYYEEENEEIDKNITLDLVFIMDITLSMENYLEFAKTKILSIIDKITEDNNMQVKLGFIGYRDYVDTDDEYIIYPELTKEHEKVKEFISSAKVAGGHNSEDMGGGLQSALNYDWKSNTRFAILIADAPCHGQQYHEIPNFDSLPKGDPKYKIDQIVKQFAEKNINFMCLNITKMTVKLYNNFVDYYKKGRKDEKNSASIYVGILEEKVNFTDKLVELIAKHAKEYYENRYSIID